MNPIEELRKLYQDAGFSEESNDEELIFLKAYVFVDHDEMEKTVEFEIKYSREYLYKPPQVIDRKLILSSMHSLYTQCWARRSEISHQVGLGIISPSLMEQQLKKLIDAHVRREYHTINESPEFTFAFSNQNCIEHSRFVVGCDVVEDVVNAGFGKVIRGLVEYNSHAREYQAKTPPNIVTPSFMVFPDESKGNQTPAYYLNVNQIPHFDWRVALPLFLYKLELLSGIQEHEVYLQNIQQEIFVIVVFFNEKLGTHDIAVFRKKNSQLILLPHARVASRNVLFSRHKEEFLKLYGKKIALLGVGAIGSILGMTLLQSGVDQLIIQDPDYVDVENITRSIYCQTDIGMSKPDAFRERARLKDVDFFSRVVTCNTLEEIESHNPDMVVVCIGDVYEEYQISHIFRNKNINNLVFVFGQNDCTWAGIYFQDSPDLGCQECLFLSQKENKELQIPYVASFAEGVGCGNPSYVSSPSDMGLISNLAAKLIIERITGKRRNSPNYYIWCSNPEPSAWRDEQPESFSLKKYRIKKHAKCSCQHFS